MDGSLKGGDAAVGGRLVREQLGRIEREVAAGENMNNATAEGDQFGA
jgi:hypothetical protein